MSSVSSLRQRRDQRRGSTSANAWRCSRPRQDGNGRDKPSDHARELADGPARPSTDVDCRIDTNVRAHVRNRERPPSLSPDVRGRRMRR